MNAARERGGRPHCRGIAALRLAARGALITASALAALAAAPTAAEASGDPDLDWWTIETPHYHVHYDRHLEPVAERVAKYAEAVHERLGKALGYYPKEYTEIVLTDDTDSANGSATAIPFNTIRLFVTAPDDISDLGDYDDWYLELITHEYTHIVHTDNISGVPALVNSIIGKSYAPNQIQPRWILEGLAVVEESQHTSGGRVRSSIFDMYLRADVLDDRIATPDQFSNDAYRWPQGNLWYLYGSRFLRWIIDVYGPNTMRAVSADYGASAIPYGLNRAIRRATGKTYIELFEGFKDHIRRQYADQMREVDRRGLRQGRRITSHGRNVSYPRFVPRNARSGGADEVVYFRDDLDELSGLYRFKLDITRGEQDESLLARTTDSASPAFAPNGDLWFNSVAVFRNLYNRNDIFRVPVGKTSTSGEESWRQQLTVGLRAQTPDVSPDGKHVVFTVNTKGTTYLEIADITATGDLANRRDLVPSARFDQAYTPRYSPDGRLVAYSSWTTGGFRDVRIVDVATGGFIEVTRDRSLDIDPVWAPDGKTLYFCSDRTGIFNVHAYDLATEELHQVTNVRVGAVQPAVSEDGKKLVYVGYTSYGFDLYAMALDRSRWLAAVTPPNDRPDQPPEPSFVPAKKAPYNPWPTLRPHNYLFNIKPGIYNSNAIELTANGGDVVGLHNISAFLHLEPSAPSPTATLDYSYDRLPFNVSVHAFHSVAPRSGFRVSDRDVVYDETNDGITSGVSYTKQETFSSHNIGFSLSAANFHGSLPVTQTPDPYAQPQATPPGGNINVAHIGYGFSNVEGGLDQPGDARGFYLNLGVDWAGAYTGSSYTVHAVSASFGGYVTMPWLHHTLAYRISGAAQGGNYPRNGAYSVGGYDVGDQNLVSTIISGVFNSSFALRGYPPGVYFGNEYVLQSTEYRFPLWFVDHFPLAFIDHGNSTLPLYLRRIDGNLFCDYGGAFDNFDIKDIRFFRNGALIDSKQLHASVGGEIWLGTTLAYALDMQFRLGYAYGFAAEAIQGGQWYFVLTSAF